MTRNSDSVRKLKIISVQEGLTRLLYGCLLEQLLTGGLSLFTTNARTELLSHPCCTASYSTQSRRSISTPYLVPSHELSCNRFKSVSATHGYSVLPPLVLLPHPSACATSRDWEWLLDITRGILDIIEIKSKSFTRFYHRREHLNFNFLILLASGRAIKLTLIGSGEGINAEMTLNVLKRNPW